MLTENDARALLAQAAATIEVGPAAPVEPVRRRAWPVLAAAVATLVAGVAVWAGVAALDTDAAPEPAVDTGPITPGEVPNVFGYQRGEARDLLTDAGYEVQVVTEEPSCHPDGRALGTQPGPGSALEPGSRVLLTVSKTWVTADCFGPEYVLWPLLDLANERGPGPQVADDVVTYVDGERAVVTDPSDPSAWGDDSALVALAHASTVAPRVARTLEPAGTTENPDGLPAGLSERPALWGRIVYDGSLGEAETPVVTVSVFTDRRDAIDTVVVETQGLPPVDEAPTPDPTPDGAATPTVPAVFGLTEGEALEVLRDAGVGNLVTEAEPGCYASGRALSTQPGSGARLDATNTVRLLVTAPQDGVCLPSTEGEELFWDLVALSRGRDTTMLAPTVTAWLDGEKSLVTDPGARGSWAAGSALDAVEAVVDAPDPAEPVRRTFRLVSPDRVVQPCSVDGQLASLPGEATGLGPGDRPGSSAWFAYQVGGVDRACVLVDILTDPQGRLAKVVVRTQDPDGLLPDLATAPESEEVADLVSVLVAFANGEWTEPPDLADEVRLYDAGDYLRTASAEELVDPTAWLVCDTAGRDTCVGSALEALAYAVGEVPFRSTEQVPSGAPPGTVSVVTVGPPEVTSCQPRGTVTLYVDSDEAIVGVDVAADTLEPLCSEEGLAPPD